MFSQTAPNVVPVWNLYCAPTFQALSSATSLGSKPSGLMAFGLVVTPNMSLVRLTLRCISYAPVTYSPRPSHERLVLYASLKDPSLQEPGSPPLPGELPPAHSGSPDGMLLLSSARFCPGENRAAKRKPPQEGDSYQTACDIRVPNSTRLSPPLLPMITE